MPEYPVADLLFLLDRCLVTDTGRQKKRPREDPKPLECMHIPETAYYTTGTDSDSIRSVRSQGPNGRIGCPGDQERQAINTLYPHSAARTRHHSLSVQYARSPLLSIELDIPDI